MTELYRNATCLPESITPVPMDKPIPSSIVPPIFKIPLHIPSISSVSSPMSEKIAIVSPSSFLKATTVQIPFVEASVHDISSAPEITLAQNVTPSLATSHINMAMTSQTTTQTSSLISTGLSIPSIDEVRDEFNEDFVISLGEYRYSKTDRFVVKRGKKRGRDHNDIDMSMVNEVVWTPQSSDPQAYATDGASILGAFTCANMDVFNSLNEEFDKQKA